MHKIELGSRHDSGIEAAWQDLSLDDDLPTAREELARKNSLDFFSATIAARPVSWQAPQWSSGTDGGGENIAGPSRSRPRAASPGVTEPASRQDQGRKDSFSVVLDMAKELEVAAEPQRPQQPVYPLLGLVRKPRPTRGRQRIGHREGIELQRLDSRTGRMWVAEAPGVPPSAHFPR
ncbi:hypothetical protein Tdes44962_MAKER00359 [Teratosphaeria destructans]|uniref:Uncharacterized protein n=1 Tax=Teratosphaeria destructans TaxID=418781 RepID=A0A9W7W292_9PEZI|nr:hypothetical protein Tdes44962_MAKER00359 [Teratosphaeria destructans]